MVGFIKEGEKLIFFLPTGNGGVKVQCSWYEKFADAFWWVFPLKYGDVRNGTVSAEI